MDSPATSVASISVAGGPPLDAKAAAAKIEDQAKHISEQEVMIKTLNKQLSHCESDLATHMDLVSTLETSLSDSEKNCTLLRHSCLDYSHETPAFYSAKGSDASDGDCEGTRLVQRATRITSQRASGSSARSYECPEVCCGRKAVIGIATRRRAASQRTCSRSARLPYGGIAETQVEIRMHLTESRGRYMMFRSDYSNVAIFFSHSLFLFVSRACVTVTCFESDTIELDFSCFAYTLLY